MTRSKAVGTFAESAVAKFLIANGWPYAERRALTGSLDKGDITGTPGLCWEVKAGKAAEDASDGKVNEWLLETEVERRNSKSAIGILVMKRRGIGGARAGEWWAVLDGGVFADLVYEPEVNPYSEFLRVPVRLHLAGLVPLLHDAGFGSY